MKILTDMNLSPRWTEVLKADGIMAVHWSEVGPATAPDPAIMKYAAEDSFVVLTNDLDFGIALAMSAHGKPSVVQIRGEDLTPEKIGHSVLTALHQMKTELEEGALLTIDPRRTRIRYLPLRNK